MLEASPIAPVRLYSKLRPIPSCCFVRRTAYQRSRREHSVRLWAEASGQQGGRAVHSIEAPSAQQPNDSSCSEHPELAPAAFNEGIIEQQPPAEQLSTNGLADSSPGSADPHATSRQQLASPHRPAVDTGSAASPHASSPAAAQEAAASTNTSDSGPAQPEAEAIGLRSDDSATASTSYAPPPPPPHVRLRRRGHRPKAQFAADHELLDSIKAAKQWQELATLYHARSGNLSAVHLSSLMNQLPKVVLKKRITRADKGHLERLLAKLTRSAQVRHGGAGRGPDDWLLPCHGALVMAFQSVF